MTDETGSLGVNKPQSPASKKRMSGHERWAAKIDPHFRKEMLELQVIQSAQPIEGNENMLYLVNVYTNYIDENFRISCAKCLARVLKHFRDMLPYLREMEKNSNLLKSL